MILWTKGGQHGPNGLYIQDVTNHNGAHYDVTVGGQATDPTVTAIAGVLIDQGAGNAQGLTCPLNVKFTGGTDPTNGAVIGRALGQSRNTETYRSLQLEP